MRKIKVLLLMLCCHVWVVKAQVTALTVLKAPDRLAQYIYLGEKHEIIIGDAIPYAATIILPAYTSVELQPISRNNYKKIVLKNNLSTDVLKPIGNEKLIDIGFLDNLKDIFSSPDYIGGPEGHTSLNSSKGTIDLYSPMLFPANEEKILSADFNFIWKKDQRKTYDFLLGIEGVSLWSICRNEEWPDTIFRIGNTSGCPNLSRNDTSKFQWTIKLTNSQTAHPISFSFATEGEAEALNFDLRVIDVELKNSGEERYYYNKAACFVYYHFYSEANKILITARKQYPHSALINNAYDNFIAGVIRRNQPSQ